MAYLYCSFLHTLNWLWTKYFNIGITHSFLAIMVCSRIYVHYVKIVLKLIWYWMKQNHIVMLQRCQRRSSCFKSMTVCSCLPGDLISLVTVFLNCGSFHVVKGSKGETAIFFFFPLSNNFWTSVAKTIKTSLEGWAPEETRLWGALCAAWGSFIIFLIRWLHYALGFVLCIVWLQLH